MEVYELLRPGRAKSKQQLLDAARTMRETHGAVRMARFIEEAAEIYEDAEALHPPFLRISSCRGRLASAPSTTRARPSPTISSCRSRKRHSW